MWLMAIRRIRVLGGLVLGGHGEGGVAMEDVKGGADAMGCAKWLWERRP